MDNRSYPLPNSALRTAFVGITFSIVGFGLMLTWLHLADALAPAYLWVTVQAIVLISISIRRIDRSAAFLLGRSRITLPFRSTDAVWSLVFLGIGTVLGIITVFESVLVLGIVALVASFLPWGRNPFCRNHFFLASTTFCIGIGTGIALEFDTFQLIFLLLATWVFWGCSSVVLLQDVSKVWAAERMANKRLTSLSASSN
jgi:hypothetical protein